MGISLENLHVDMELKGISLYVSMMYILHTIIHIFADHYTFLGNCLPTPPLSQHFALNDK